MEVKSSDSGKVDCSLSDVEYYGFSPYVFMTDIYNNPDDEKIIYNLGLGLRVASGEKSKERWLNDPKLKDLISDKNDNRVYDYLQAFIYNINKQSQNIFGNINKPSKYYYNKRHHNFTFIRSKSGSGFYLMMYASKNGWCKGTLFYGSSRPSVIAPFIDPYDYKRYYPKVFCNFKYFKSTLSIKDLKGKDVTVFQLITDYLRKYIGNYFYYYYLPGTTTENYSFLTSTSRNYITVS